MGHVRGARYLAEDLSSSLNLTGSFDLIPRHGIQLAKDLHKPLRPRVVYSTGASPETVFIASNASMIQWLSFHPRLP